MVIAGASIRYSRARVSISDLDRMITLSAVGLWRFDSVLDLGARLGIQLGSHGSLALRELSQA